MGYGNASNTSWVGVLLGIFFLATILLGALLGGSELFNPWTAQEEANRIRVNTQYEAAKQAMEIREREQALAQQQQDLEAWLVLREKIVLTLTDALAFAIKAVGVGGGICLVAVGVALLLEQKRLAERAAAGGRVLPFPSAAQSQAKRLAVG